MDYRVKRTHSQILIALRRKHTWIIIAFIVSPIFTMRCNSSASEGDIKELSTFLNNLPKASAALPIKSVSNEERYWNNFLRYKKPINLLFDPLDIRPFLQRELIFSGFKIREVTHSRANGRIGFTTCDGGAPLIIYPSTADPRIDQVNFTFFREHEFAHIKLGHIKCNTGSSSPQLQQLELDADCEAARTLELINKDDGTRIIERAIGTFRGMQLSATSTHPSSNQRATALHNNCK